MRDEFITLYSRFPSSVVAFFIADVALALLYLINYAVHQPFPFVTKLINLNADNNIPNWYSSMQLFVVAYLSGIYAFRLRERTNKGFWLMSTGSLVFVFLSMDEAIKIHEWIGWRLDALILKTDRANTLFPQTGIWMFILGPAFAILIFFLISKLRPYIKRRPGFFRKYATGIVIFIGSACGIEVFANFALTPLLTHLQIFFEELGEMIGVTVILWAVYELLSEAAPAIDPSPP